MGILRKRAAKVHSVDETKEWKDAQKHGYQPRRAPKKMNKEIRQKISESNSGKESSEEKNAAISEAMKALYRERRKQQLAGLICFVRKYQGLLYNGTMKRVGRKTYRFPGWEPTQILTFKLKAKKGKEAKLRENLEAIGLKRREHRGRFVWCRDSSGVFTIV